MPLLLLPSSHSHSWNQEKHNHSLSSRLAATDDTTVFINFAPPFAAPSTALQLGLLYGRQKYSLRRLGSSKKDRRAARQEQFDDSSSGEEGMFQAMRSYGCISVTPLLRSIHVDGNCQTLLHIDKSSMGA